MPAGKRGKSTKEQNTSTQENTSVSHPSPREIEDEISFLRQKFNSLTLRGHYAECIKLIEDNLRMLYTKERWPENFFAVLRIHQRCYPLDSSQTHEEYMTALLAKNDIPTVFATLLKGPDRAIRWNAEAFKELALKSQGEGELELALSYCELLIKIDPGNSNAYLLKGWILDELGRGPEAVAMFEQALELNETNHSATISLAKHWTKTKPGTALEYINSAIEKVPDEASYLGIKAGILLRMGNREGAMACYDDAATMDPYNPEFPYQKAELLLGDDKIMAAITQYNRTLALNSKHIPCLIRLANLNAELQPEAALGYINTVVAADTENRDAHLLKAKLHHKLGQAELAIKQYKLLLTLDEKCHEALGGLGELYLAIDAAQAQDYFQQAIALAPAVSGYHFGLARAHQSLQDTVNAIKEYKQTISLDKRNARAFAQLGYLHTESKPSAAVDYFSKAIALAPENASYHTAKGELLLKQGNTASAVEFLSNAAKYDPGNPQVHLDVAAVLEQMGNTVSAIEHYKLAVSLAPGGPVAYYRLARLLLDTEPELSLSYISSAISMDVTNGEYYYYKSKILAVLSRDQDALEQLQEKMDTGKHADAAEELSQILAGDSLRVALMYVNRAVELAPDNATYIGARADILYDMGQKAKALAQYQQQLKLDSASHGAMFGIARVLASKKDKKALEFFEKSIAAEPKIPAYHAEKAAFLAGELERYDEAQAAYDAAIALDTQAWPTVLEKARLLDLCAELDSARDYYRRVLLVNPDCLEATARMGVLLADRAPNAALDYLRHAIDLDPDSYLYHAWRGRALSNLGREDDAVGEYNQTLAIGGGAHDVYYTLAGIIREKMPDTALKYCVRALGMKADEAKYHLLLGDIHQQLHDDGAAIRCYDAALGLDAKCHMAIENIAGILYRRADPACLERVNAALERFPSCPRCLLLKAKILDELSEDSQTAAAIECAAAAVKVAPDEPLYREKLVELLQKNKSFLRLALEKSKLGKLRRKLAIPVPEEESVLPRVPAEGEPGGA